MRGNVLFSTGRKDTKRAAEALAFFKNGFMSMPFFLFKWKLNKNQIFTFPFRGETLPALRKRSAHMPETCGCLRLQSRLSHGRQDHNSISRLRNRLISSPGGIPFHALGAVCRLTEIFFRRCFRPCARRCACCPSQGRRRCDIAPSVRAVLPNYPEKPLMSFRSARQTRHNTRSFPHR